MKFCLIPQMSPMNWFYLMCFNLMNFFILFMYMYFILINNFCFMNLFKNLLFINFNEYEIFYKMVW